MLIKYWQSSGWRLRNIDHYLPIINGIAMIPVVAALAGLLTTLIWSVAGNWFFPDTFPKSLHMQHWQDYPSYFPLIKNSFWLASGASILAVLSSLICSYVLKPKILANKWLIGLIYMPFFIPQISFLFGMQIS